MTKTINLQSKPFIPNGWTVEEHDTSLKKITVSDISLHIEPEQEEGRIKGTELRERMKGKGLNANVLDYLLKPENQHLIPENWKGKAVFFWGTIYRDSGGSLCVRYLYFNVDRWIWRYFWLGCGFYSSSPAAVRMGTSSSDTKSLPSVPLSLESRVERIEKWIDFWETVETGWRKE